MVSMERHGGAPEHIGPAPHPQNVVTKEVVQEMNANGKIKKNLVNPPLKGPTKTQTMQTFQTMQTLQSLAKFPI